MAGVEHVFPEIADMLSADDSSRIRSIQEERWVSYPKAVAIIRKLERLLEFPRRSRMPCLLIVGRSGMGKTMLLERFCRQNCPAWEPEHDREHTPVLSVVIRPQPNIRRFYGQILSALKAPTASTAASGVIEDRVYHLLRALGTRMLIVDEVHNVFTAARSSDRDAMMALLRTLPKTPSLVMNSWPADMSR